MHRTTDGGVFAAEGGMWTDCGVWVVEACCAVVGHEFITRMGDGEGVDRSHEGEEGRRAKGGVRGIWTRTIAPGLCRAK